MDHIVIIGNGIAGVTTARHIRKNSDNKITIVSAESDYFFSRTALMYVYMGHMRWKDIEPYEKGFWARNRISLVHAYATGVDVDEKAVLLENGTKLKYDKLVLATGSVTNTFGWEGQESKQVLGLVSKQDLEKLEAIAPDNKTCPSAVIVGGGLIGVELAEMLCSRGIQVTFLVREAAFWTGVLPRQEAEMISRHILSHGVDLRQNTQLKKILADEHGMVTGVETTAGEVIPCKMVGITTGVKPNISFLENSPIETDKGILVNAYLETNIPGIYAIGDCAQQREPTGGRPPVEAVWYTGRMMGEALAQTLCGNPSRYSPGHWFNSAKFFDIEYQTYGWVLPEKRKGDSETQFHWKHEDDDKCITLSYHAETRKFLGINTFGIRMRHEIFDSWLTEGKSVDFVIDQLPQANFDPEFSRAYETEIRTAFYTQQKTLTI